MKEFNSWSEWKESERFENDVQNLRMYISALGVEVSNFRTPDLMTETLIPDVLDGIVDKATLITNWAVLLKSKVK